MTGEVIGMFFCALIGAFVLVLCVTGIVVKVIPPLPSPAYQVDVQQMKQDGSWQTIFSGAVRKETVGSNDYLNFRSTIRELK